MKVEILFPEVCSLFGDYGNIIFLEENLGKENVYKTSLNQTPRFVSEEIDLIYMGAMSEKTQIEVLNILSKHKEVLKDKIEQGLKVLFTGNANDLLGQKIIEEDKSEIEGLALFEFETVLKRSPRLNDTILGKTKDGFEILGHKTQFTQSFGDNTKNYFCETEIGMGMNKKSKLEGVRYKGVVGTNLTGPLLILNPDFAQKYLEIEIKHTDQLLQAKHTKIEDIKRYYRS